MAENRKPDIPSEDEIFEYFLGKTLPEDSRRISAWLKQNPAREKELREWQLLQDQFSGMTLQVPNPEVLNRVRQVARDHLKKTEPSAPIAEVLSFWNRVFTRRTIGLSFTLAALLVAHFTLSDLNLRQTEQLNAVKTPVVTNSKLASRPLNADATGSVSTTKDAASIPPESLLKDYATALAAYEQDDFLTASRLFSSIMAQSPSFEKREELYSYWVESLKQMGKFKLAEKKQKLLEEIRATKIK